MFKIIMMVSIALLGRLPSSYCQFNDTTNYYANFTSTGLVNKTNDGSSYVLNNNIKVNVYKKSYSLNTTNAWIFGRQRDKTTNNDFISSIDFNLFKEERHIYYWALAGYEKSLSLKINYRVQSGAGIGYYLIDRETFVLQLSNGLLYEKSDLYDNEISSNDYQTLRNSLRLKFRVIVRDIFVIESTDFLQHSLEDRRDYIIKLHSNMSVKLLQWLWFTVTINYNKLSVTERENLLCNFGLTAEKYF